MASFLTVHEYQGGSLAGIQAPVTPPVVRQPRVDFTAGVASSAAFGGDTRLIMVSCNASCSVVVGGKAPVATTDDEFFAAGKTQAYVVTPGDKLSVIANS